MKVLATTNSEITDKINKDKLTETRNCFSVDTKEYYNTYDTKDWVPSADGISATIFPRRAERFRQNKIFSIDKAKKELGYKPRVRLSGGLKKTAQWYR